MGVTIYFEGNLKSPDNYDIVIEIAKHFAHSNDLPFSMFQENDKLLERVKNEEDWDYQGATKGISIELDQITDPLNLEFDKDLYIQEYCKTQFGDIKIHVQLINLLRQFEPYFKKLTIIDEGEYWETGDITLLKTHFDNTFQAIEDLKKENENLDGPYRLDNGRIIDLM